MAPARRPALPPLIALLLVATLTSCDDGPTAPKPEVLAGTWTATKAEYVSKTSSSRVDLVAAGGAVTLLLEANGAYVYVEVPAGQAPDTTRGAWSASGEVMTMTPEGMPYSLEFDLQFGGNTLGLTGGGAFHDFGSGGEEATLNLAFVR